MKYNIEDISPSQYLDLVNREEDPGLDALNIRYIKHGAAYFAYSNSSVGKIMSPLKHKTAIDDLEKYFDELTTDISAVYKARKEGQIGPSNFLGNPSKPGF